MSPFCLRGSVPTMRHRLILLSLLLCLFLLLGIPIADAHTQENEHALGDAYWADLAQDYPPFEEAPAGAVLISGNGHRVAVSRDNDTALAPRVVIRDSLS